MVNESHSSDTNGQTSGVTIDAVAGGIHDSIIAGRDVIQKFTQIFTADIEQQHAQRNRRAMLGRVKHDWVKGVLEKSLHGAAMIELGLEERANAVERPWDMVLQTPDQPNRPLTLGTKMVNVFDEMNQALLILGAPGSGKTTMLLELARDTIARAEKDPTQPIPVVLNLSSWAEKRQPIAEWLLDELNTKYDIPKRISRPWFEKDDSLLLLDGLDEVKLEHREACVKALNDFRREHGLTPLVVCSRIADYEALTTRLKLQGAVLLQPLTLQQVDQYFEGASTELLPVRDALQHDTALQELAQSPLMLSVMTLAYRGMSAEDLGALDSIEARLRHVLDAYVQRMLKRRGADKRYTPQQTIHWLAGLARMMSQHTQTEFFIEAMQPAWLPARVQRLLYDVGVRLAGGLAFVLACVLAAVLAAVLAGEAPDALTGWLTDGLRVGLAFGLAFELAGVLAVRLPVGLAVALAAGLTIVPASRLFIGNGESWNWAGGLIAGLAFGLPGGLAGVSVADRDRIRIAETLSWSWKKAKWGLAAGLVVGLVVWPITRDLADGLAVGLPVGLAFMLALGLTRCELVETRATPNQGIRRSARNAIRIGLAAVLAGVSPSALVGAFGLIIGLPIGLAVGLAVGGSACIQHVVLRLILYRNEHIPWNLARFLDYAAERIFLRKVGGGYIFVHRLLLDYFAALET